MSLEPVLSEDIIGCYVIVIILLLSLCYCCCFEPAEKTNGDNPRCHWSPSCRRILLDAMLLLLSLCYFILLLCFVIVLNRRRKPTETTDNQRCHWSPCCRRILRRCGCSEVRGQNIFHNLTLINLPIFVDKG